MQPIQYFKMNAYICFVAQNQQNNLILCSIMPLNADIGQYRYLCRLYDNNIWCITKTDIAERFDIICLLLRSSRYLYTIYMYS